MLVRAIRTHYHGVYRKEGDEFDWDGPLYIHIEAVKQAQPEKAEEPEQEETVQVPEKHNQKKK